MILQHLGDLLEHEPRLPRGAHVVVRKTLAACALTQRKWRYLSQKFLHRVITVHGRSIKKNLDHYVEAPQGHDHISADISQYPQQLRILYNDVGRDGELNSSDFKAFGRRCGPRITRISFVASSFSHPVELLKVLCHFPSVQQVSICQRWPTLTPQYTLDRYDLNSVAPPARSLETICVRTDHQGLLQVVRDWLLLNPKVNIRHLVWPLLPGPEVHSDAKLMNALGDSLSGLCPAIPIPQGGHRSYPQSGTVPV